MVVESFRDGTRRHEGQEDGIHLPFLGRGGVSWESFVSVRVSEQGPDLLVIILTIHHYSSIPLICWYSNNRFFFLQLFDGLVLNSAEVGGRRSSSGEAAHYLCPC